MPDYASMTLIDLREELKKRKVKTSGRKNELIERLCSLDQMGVSGVEDMEAEFHMSLPEPSAYKDIHSGVTIQQFKRDRMEAFFNENQRVVEPKFQDLYKQRFMRYIRMAKKDNVLYISANIWAEMRRKASYKVDFSIDDVGVVQESQCECPVGQGPSAHCKHVGVAMHGLVEFCQSKNVITEQTCTQKLQTFHKAQPHKGSPLVANTLGKFNKSAKCFKYDPRPVPLRRTEGYADRFRNIMLNYQCQHPASGGRTMPVLQLYKPANPYALFLDHDYGTSSEEAFVTRAKLHQISQTDQEQTEMQTRGQADNSTWKEVRALRITASRFGEICRATERKDMDKMVDSIISPKTFTSKATAHGRKYESVAVEAFEQLKGTTSECGIFICREHPWLAASPDRIVDDKAIVEIKCPFVAKDQPINPITVPYLQSGEKGLELKNNHIYYYQVQGQLMCAERDVCYFCVYTLQDFQVIEIQRDDDFIEKMVEKLRGFYNEFFYPRLIEKHVFFEYGKYF